MKAIRVHKYGGSEVLTLEDLPTPQPGPGQALVKIEAIGLNFIDVYQRTGLYPAPLPRLMGVEGAGVVEAIGPDVTEVRVDDRVAYTGVPGSYAEYAIVPAERLVTLPPGVDTHTAAAAMLQGMTAHYLVHTTYPLKRGNSCLVHAAAGGVGLLLCQMARDAGARVFGTVSTEEKARLAREAGAEVAIRYTEQDFEAEIKRLTNGQGLQVVYDSVAKDTFEKSLNCLAPRGYLVLYGQSSGPVPPFDVNQLSAKGSLFLTRPTLAHYTRTREELLERATDVLNAVSTGTLKLRIGATFPLAEAAEAHRQLEGRKTTGKVLLIP
ncbi:MAG: quinone oxidoreductase [Candidatus Methylomirabilales bacterium]|jgi:NADPH2:quinone reductase|nr:quinone oxidoreductase [candidate division NC10 bacterium]